MPTSQPPKTRLPMVYQLLLSWMQLVAYLVPEPDRVRWCAEWDAELWYGVASKVRAAQIRTAVVLSVGMLRDALEVRRLTNATRRSPRRRGDTMFRSILSDVRFCLRLLRKAPGFTTVIAVTLSLGIGATTAIFTVVHALLLNPLPFPDSDRLVVLWQGRTGKGIDKDWLSPAQFSDIRDGSDVFEILTMSDGRATTMTGRGLPTELGYIRVSSSFFDMFGGSPIVGRLVDERDDAGDAATVAVLTHGLWQTAFGGNTDVVGQTITIANNDVEIVGVLSPDVLLDNEVFPTVGAVGHVDLVLSLRLSEQRMADRDGENYNVFGKVKPGVSIEQVQASMDLVAERLSETYEEPGTGFFIDAVPMLEEVVGKVRQGLMILMASVGVLLLIACGNVANLLLSRSNARQNELGVRVAVGAGRARLVRQLLTESVLLALLGGTLGVGLAVGAVAFLRRVGEHSLPRLAEIGVHGNVLAFATLITLATTIAFGLLPALRLSVINVVDVIKTGGRGTLGDGGGWSRLNLSHGLVVAEIGLSLVLLIGAGLLTRSMGMLQRVDPGFAPEQTLTFRYSLSGAPYREATRRTAFVDELEERIASLPGVRVVGGVSLLPFAPGVSWGDYSVEGYVPPAGEDESIIADSRVVTPGYFGTMGISLLQGRTFDERDRNDSPRVAIVDQRFAEKVFADRDPIGGRIEGPGEDWAEIIGVVAPVKQEELAGEAQHYAVYYPYAQVRLRRMYSTVKTSAEPGSFVGAIRRVVADMDDRVAVVDVSSMNQRLADSLAERRFSMLMLRVFSVVAMILAAVGTYGLISYRVSQGTHELGMRVALGAPRGAIAKLVLGHGMLLAGVGVVLGLAGALVLTRLMTAMLFGVSATDGLTYAGVSALLLVTVFVACFVPARRATTVDPLDALRAE